jgi:pyruvyltransferase
MKFWWYDNPANYGDILTPFILANLNLNYEFASREKAEAIMVGSIAKWARPGMHVFGSGFIRQADEVSKNANWHWVRGPLSRQKIIDAGGTCSEVYGDPAFILPEIFGGGSQLHDVGIVPHHVDYEYAKQNHSDFHVINLLNPDVAETTCQITSCRAIISSSLHGLIVAHAYGIPAAWVQFSDKLHGDGLKFADHFASIGMEPVLSDFNDPQFTLGQCDPKPMIEILKSCCR